MVSVNELGKRAKGASQFLLTASGEQKNKALYLIADAIEQNKAAITAANEQDLIAGKTAGLTDALLDRLALTDARIKGMADGVREVAALQDPVGEILSGKTLADGMKLTKVRVPLGVIGIIFESRPNVTADAAALCLKAGNTVILRGGKEAIHSNTAIVNVMRGALEAVGFPADCVNLIEDTSRDSARQLMELNEYLDVLIPRGGAGLIAAVVQNATVPVIETGTGNCHVYADKDADIDMAVNIIYNAKTSRPSVCNAIETVLIHREVAQTLLPLMQKSLAQKQVELRGCEKTMKILSGVTPATEADYETEFLDYILAVKVVDNIEEAIGHIARYGSGHSECIVTENYNAAQSFTAQVDAAAVYVNASTRFTDGGMFGLGAEIGISTQKLHARGPMGLSELTSNKYIILGQGQVR